MFHSQFCIPSIVAAVATVAASASPSLSVHLDEECVFTRSLTRRIFSPRHNYFDVDVFGEKLVSETLVNIITHALMDEFPYEPLYKLNRIAKTAVKMYIEQTWLVRELADAYYFYEFVTEVLMEGDEDD